MNEPIDPLEAELAALKPHEPSSRLRGRLEERLTDVPARLSRRWWGLALTGGLAAAALVAVAAFGPWRPGPDKDQNAEPKLARSTPVASPKVASREWASAEFPTLLAYRRALARSPEDLNALLDKHTWGDLTNGDSPPPPNTFLRSDSDFRSWIGGL